MLFCSKCKLEKDESEFTIRPNRKRGYYSSCKDCKNKYKRNNYSKTERQLKYNNSKEHVSLTYKNYRNNNKEKESTRHKLYDSNNREKINKRRQLKRLSDSNYKVKTLLRKRLYDCVHKGYKSITTLDLLGCTIDELKLHLQQTAISNGYLDFNINNYNGKMYHIDHIIPCSKFNLKCSYHQKLCFNWSNLQILKASDNIRKSNR